jgi:predicted enzyme related to lactoylglutathione lyase
MPARLQSLTILSADPERLAAFWRQLLGPSGESDLPFALVVEPGDVPKVGLNQVHLHLTSNAAAQEDTVERALALGATHLDVGQLPEEDHFVLADPDGNEFCVIEAGNSWLAGTGFLGELAADGTREVGVFWSEALGWPLVHDADGETAIQSPDGGVKIAWGGPPLNERRGRNRMHFVLEADDLDAEVERLVGLGASVVERGVDETEMADPDGNELRVRA